MFKEILVFIKTKNFKLMYFFKGALAHTNDLYFLDIWLVQQ